MSTYIIAEAGVNHNGSLDMAKEMVITAKKIGVDAIKFQTFITENLVTKSAQKAEYQKSNTSRVESQFEMLKKLEFSYDDYAELKELCEKLDIDFISTPFDLDSIDMLLKLDIDKLKLPSGEITNYPYLVKMAKTQKPIIMSSGMCTMNEIEDAITILKENGTIDLSLLHCTTEYPAPYEEVNLSAINTMKAQFKLNTGYSDHTRGIEIPIAAVALGATIIEKHFTLNHNAEGPDHKASLEPQEMAQMVKAIRNVESSIGNGEKSPSPSEMKNISIVRKSIVARTNICCGDLFTEDNLTTKRPGTGLSPMYWKDLLGKRALRDFKKDELIRL